MPSSSSCVDCRKNRREIDDLLRWRLFELRPNPSTIFMITLQQLDLLLEISNHIKMQIELKRMKERVKENILLLPSFLHKSEHRPSDEDEKLFSRFMSFSNGWTVNDGSRKFLPVLTIIQVFITKCSNKKIYDHVILCLCFFPLPSSLNFRLHLQQIESRNYCGNTRLLEPSWTSSFPYIFSTCNFKA